jgi:GDP-L-fucose synthase
MPDGTPRKLLDTTRLTDLGWTYKTPLEDGLRSTYEWFLRSKHATA